MRYGIVEGEPGIFPAPIASLMRKIGGFFDRRSGERGDPQEPATPDEPKETGPADEPQPGVTADDGTDRATRADEPPPGAKAAGDGT